MARFTDFTGEAIGSIPSHLRKSPIESTTVANTMTPTPTAAKRRNLDAAKAAKNDEFYTQWADIEREMNAYLDYDPDVFRDKVILLPCDDPEWSNFAKFFALHFVDFGLKKLISTSYAPDSNPARVGYQPTLFETESASFDASKSHANGKKFTLEPKDFNGDAAASPRRPTYRQRSRPW